MTQIHAHIPDVLILISRACLSSRLPAHPREGPAGGSVQRDHPLPPARSDHRKTPPLTPETRGALLIDFLTPPHPEQNPAPYWDPRHPRRLTAALSAMWASLLGMGPCPICPGAFVPMLLLPAGSTTRLLLLTAQAPSGHFFLRKVLLGPRITPPGPALIKPDMNSAAHLHELPLTPAPGMGALDGGLLSVLFTPCPPSSTACCRATETPKTRFPVHSVRGGVGSGPALRGCGLCCVRQGTGSRGAFSRTLSTPWAGRWCWAGQSRAGPPQERGLQQGACCLTSWEPEESSGLSPWDSPTASGNPAGGAAWEAGPKGATYCQGLGVPRVASR